VVEERARRKARDAAVKKAKPLWEEDGKVRLECVQAMAVCCMASKNIWDVECC
jgi:hypothetical protein